MWEKGGQCTCLVSALAEDTAVEGGLAVGGLGQVAHQQDRQGEHHKLGHLRHHLLCLLLRLTGSTVSKNVM